MFGAQRSHGSSARPDLVTGLGTPRSNWVFRLSPRKTGNRARPREAPQSVLMSVWRTCWQQRRSALDFLSQLLRSTLLALALPP